MKLTLPYKFILAIAIVGLAVLSIVLINNSTKPNHDNAGQFARETVSQEWGRQYSADTSYQGVELVHVHFSETEVWRMQETFAKLGFSDAAFRRMQNLDGITGADITTEYAPLYEAQWTYLPELGLLDITFSVR